MPHQKLIRVLHYVWLLVVFPVAVAILVGVLGHSATLVFKTLLLIECGMVVLSPLLNAVIGDGNHTHHHRRKQFSSAGMDDVVTSFASLEVNQRGHVKTSPEVSNFVAQLSNLGRFVPENIHRPIELEADFFIEGNRFERNVIDAQVSGSCDHMIVPWHR